MLLRQEASSCWCFVCCCLPQRPRSAAAWLSGNAERRSLCRTALPAERNCLAAVYGNAERRSLCREDDELVGMKCEYALSQGLKVGLVLVNTQPQKERAGALPATANLVAIAVVTYAPAQARQPNRCQALPLLGCRSLLASARRWSSGRAATCGT